MWNIATYQPNHMASDTRKIYLLKNLMIYTGHRVGLSDQITEVMMSWTCSKDREKRNACRILIEKLLGKPRRLEDNTKADRKKISCNGWNLLRIMPSSRICYYLCLTVAQRTNKLTSSALSTSCSCFIAIKWNSLWYDLWFVSMSESGFTLASSSKTHEYIHWHGESMKW